MIQVFEILQTYEYSISMMYMISIICPTEFSKAITNKDLESFVDKKISKNFQGKISKKLLFTKDFDNFIVKDFEKLLFTFSR